MKAQEQRPRTGQVAREPCRVGGEVARQQGEPGPQPPGKTPPSRAVRPLTRDPCLPRAMATSGRGRYPGLRAQGEAKRGSPTPTPCGIATLAATGTTATFKPVFVSHRTQPP